MDKGKKSLRAKILASGKLALISDAGDMIGCRGLHEREGSGAGALKFPSMFVERGRKYHRRWRHRRSISSVVSVEPRKP